MEPRELEIPQEVDELEKSIIVLDDLLGKVAAQLVPVRSARVVAEGENEGTPQKSLCDHADKLRSLRYNVENANNRLRDLLDTLEL